MLHNFPTIADTRIIMAVIVELVTAFAVMFPLLAAPTVAGSIADIEHVILFMQGTQSRYLQVLFLMIDRKQSLRSLSGDNGRG